MVELDNVNILSRKTMQAVASLCPNLREISFIEKRTDQQDDLLSLAELQSILVAGTFKVFLFYLHSTSSKNFFNIFLSVSGRGDLSWSIDSQFQLGFGCSWIEAVENEFSLVQGH